ncbi:hypothetical protein [Microvirga sp. 2TAF3]|uniref:hypothetical protein n=1 Tax=Microvirga sp. 2TAF3 TaxID=3233014 RepID=UPI003F9DBAB6
MNRVSMYPADAGSSNVLDVRAYEEVLACNIKDVVGDLCLADADIIMAYVTKKLHGNMNEIVASSTELFFKDKTLTYTHSADVDTQWGPTPGVILNMAFAYGPVNVLFKLVLGDKYAGVQIEEMTLTDCSVKGLFDAIEFGRVLKSARLKPLPPHLLPGYYSPKNATHN